MVSKLHPPLSCVVLMGWCVFLCRNPLWLVGLGALFFLLRALWVQLEVGEELSRGWVSDPDP